MKIKEGDMVLTDLDQYSDEWPQVGQVISVISGLDTCKLHWFKGCKSGTWNPCTIPMPGQRGKRMPWVEEVKKGSIWLVFELTHKKLLPKNVKDAIDKY